MGPALSTAAQGSLIDIVGASFFPLYSVVGPMIFFLSLMLLVWGGLRLVITILVRIIVIVRCKGCGLWVLTALWGTLFQLAISPFSWMDAAMEGVGDRVGQMMETEAAREPEEEKPKRRSLSMEDLRRKYSWWPNGGGQGRTACPPHRHGGRRWRRCGPARHQEHQVVNSNKDNITRGVCWIL
jgi:hypothetical protein